MSALPTHANRHFAARAFALAAAAMAVVVATPLAAHASFSATPDDTARVNGTVYAVAQVGDRTIIGGVFTEVGGRPRTNVAAIRADGSVDPNFAPNADGVVRSIAGSSDGSRVFLGGEFATVGGAARANLAAVAAAPGDPLVDGTVVDGWSADTKGTYPGVLALATSGSRLYVGGTFGGVDGTGRKRLAAIDANTGNLITSFTPAPDGAVRFLEAKPDGTSVFAGGKFNNIGGAARGAGVAQLDLTGQATDFAPADQGSNVTAMGTSPTGERVYYGVANNQVFAYDVLPGDTGHLWTQKNGGDTQAIDATEDEVFLGGHFSNNITDKVKRKWIQSVNADTGSVTAWDPGLDGGLLGVWDIEVADTKLLVGGQFTTAGNGTIVSRRFARFSLVP